MKYPQLSIAPNKLVTKKITVTDHVATGDDARRYRKQMRVTVAQVAADMRVSSEFIRNAERGLCDWYEWTVEAYCRAVQKAAVRKAR